MSNYIWCMIGGGAASANIFYAITGGEFRIINAIVAGVLIVQCTFSLIREVRDINAA